VVVIGAGGHFGGRICRRLLDEPSVRLVVAGRSLARNEALAASLLADTPAATVVPAEIDVGAADFADRLADLEPAIVLHTAGPYQGQDYIVAKTCVDIGSHYLDLADARDFVVSFSRLHEEAVRRNVLLVTGASTLPGLSSAVIAACRPHFATLSSIAICIAPAHRTPRGTGTVAAVLSYCGKPFPVLENGRWRTRYGWQDLRVQHLPVLGRRLSAACDVPDLALFPDLYEGLRTVTFHAALEAPLEQLALWLMAGLCRSGIVRDWQSFAPRMRRIGAAFAAMGSEDGGMSVIVAGTDTDGQSRRATFSLVARHNHGPEIPCAPLLVIARKLLHGNVNARGALPCIGLMNLEEFTDELRDFDIGWTMDFR
jgi:Saccharopine dehydrogenase NADP binding domain